MRFKFDKKKNKEKDEKPIDQETWGLPRITQSTCQSSVYITRTGNERVLFFFLFFSSSLLLVGYPMAVVISSSSLTAYLLPPPHFNFIRSQVPI